MRRRSDYPVYLAMRAAGAVLMALPRPVALAAGAALGRAARALGMRRKVTDDNLAAAFPELSPHERERLAARTYAHFGRMTVDSLRLSSRGPEVLRSLVDGGETVQVIREGLKRGRGVIVLTGHLGNWELAGAYLGAVGIPLAAVVKPPSNPHVADQAEQARQRLGIQTIPMPEARLGVLEALKRNRSVALVADQGALRSQTWVPFFGRPTRTPSGPGVFAVRSGAPVVFGALLARPGNRYELMVDVLVDEVRDEPGAAEDVARRYRAALEELVRRAPEQYLWTHRLWKQPPPTPAPGAP